MDNRTFIRSTKTTDKKIADALEAKWKNEVVKSEYLGNRERITLTDCLARCLETKRNLASYSRIKDFGKMVKQFFSSDPFVDAINNKDVYRFKHLMNEKGYAPATSRHLMNFFRQSIENAEKMGYQTPKIEYPKITVKPTRLRYLSLDEEKQLLESLDPYRPIRSQPSYSNRKPEFNYSQHQHYDFIVMLLDTGARFSEIATIEWAAIDLENKTIRLWRPKVRNESILYMTDRLYQILKRRSEEKLSEYVFTDSNNGPMKYIPRMWSRIFKRSGLIDVTPHTLRHTLASRLVQSGLSIYEVKEILGHSDIQTTMRYSHLERVDAMKKAKDVLNALNLTATHTKNDTSLKMVD